MEREIQRPPRKRTCFRQDPAATSAEKSAGPEQLVKAADGGGSSYLTRLLQSPAINVSGDRSKDWQCQSQPGQGQACGKRDADQGRAAVPAASARGSGSGGPAWESFIHEIVDRAQSGATERPRQEIPQPASGHLLKFYMRNNEDPISHYMESHSSPAYSSAQGERGSSTIAKVQSATMSPLVSDCQDKPSARQALIKHLTQSMSAKHVSVAPGNGKPPSETCGSSAKGSAKIVVVEQGRVVQKGNVQSTASERENVMTPVLTPVVTPGVLDLSLPRPKPADVQPESHRLAPGQEAPKSSNDIVQIRQKGDGVNLPASPSTANAEKLLTGEGNLETVNKSQNVSGITSERSSPSITLRVPSCNCSCDNNCLLESSPQGVQRECLSPGCRPIEEKCALCRRHTDSSCLAKPSQSVDIHSFSKSEESHAYSKSEKIHADSKSDEMHAYSESEKIYAESKSDEIHAYSKSEEIHAYSKPATQGDYPKGDPARAENPRDSSARHGYLSNINPSGGESSQFTKTDGLLPRKVLQEGISLASMTEYFVDIAIRKGVILSDV